jgi:hypothetical protein
MHDVPHCTSLTNSRDQPAFSGNIFFNTNSPVKYISGRNRADCRGPFSILTGKGIASFSFNRLSNSILQASLNISWCRIYRDLIV